MKFPFCRKHILFYRKLVSAVLALCFSLFTVVSPAGSQAIPMSGMGIASSAAFQPPVLRGMSVHPENPLLFDFIVDRGQDKIGNELLKDESTKLIKYFLTSMTIPDKDAWVNLSPYEKDRIIPDALGQTEMGRVMLEQDYVLKQLASSLTNPDTELGKKFWAKVGNGHDRSLQNKVWIVPAGATVVEKDGFAYITESKLKVMLDEDYGSQNLSSPHALSGDPLPKIDSRFRGNDIEKLSTQVFREMILPKLIEEVNTGKNFAVTRQVYQSVILAAWYKRALKDSLLGKIYADKSKIAGVESDEKDTKQKVYEQYLEAFKKGAYNVIKEEAGPDGELIPRKYISGGYVMSLASSSLTVLDDPGHKRASAAIEELSQDQIVLVAATAVEPPEELSVVVSSSAVPNTSDGPTRTTRISLADSLWQQSFVPRISQDAFRKAVFTTTGVSIKGFRGKYFDKTEIPYSFEIVNSQTAREQLAKIMQELADGNQQSVREDILNSFLREVDVPLNSVNKNVVGPAVDSLLEDIKKYNAPFVSETFDGIKIEYYRIPREFRADVASLTSIIQELIIQEALDRSSTRPIVVERIINGGFDNRVDLVTFPDNRRYIVKSVFKFEEDYGLPDSYLKNHYENLIRLKGVENIARAVLYGSKLDYDYLVMDYLPGESLADRVKEKGLLPVHEVVDIGVGLARVTGSVHERGVIVRDLLPQNIHLGPLGIYLYDFDVSSTDYYNWGKDEYKISGEIIRPRFDYSDKGERIQTSKSDEQLDIAYIGEALYFAVTGQNLPDRLEDITQDDISNKELLRIVRRTVASRSDTSKNGRYKNVDELLADLESLQKELKASSPGTAGPQGYGENISEKTSSSSVDVARRNFLKAAGAGVTAMLLPHLTYGADFLLRENADFVAVSKAEDTFEKIVEQLISKSVFNKLDPVKRKEILETAFEKFKQENPSAKLDGIDAALVPGTSFLISDTNFYITFAVYIALSDIVAEQTLWLPGQNISVYYVRPKTVLGYTGAMNAYGKYGIVADISVFYSLSLKEKAKNPREILEAVLQDALIHELAHMALWNDFSLQIQSTQPWVQKISKHLKWPDARQEVWAYLIQIAQTKIPPRLIMNTLKPYTNSGNFWQNNVEPTALASRIVLWSILDELGFGDYLAEEEIKEQESLQEKLSWFKKSFYRFSIAREWAKKDDLFLVGQMMESMDKFLATKTTQEIQKVAAGIFERLSGRNIPQIPTDIQVPERVLEALLGSASSGVDSSIAASAGVVELAPYLKVRKVVESAFTGIKNQDVDWEWWEDVRNSGDAKYVFIAIFGELNKLQQQGTVFRSDIVPSLNYAIAEKVILSLIDKVFVSQPVTEAQRVDKSLAQLNAIQVNPNLARFNEIIRHLNLGRMFSLGEIRAGNVPSTISVDTWQSFLFPALNQIPKPQIWNVDGNILRRAQDLFLYVKPYRNREGQLLNDGSWSINPTDLRSSAESFRNLNDDELGMYLQLFGFESGNGGFVCKDPADLFSFFMTSVNIHTLTGMAIEKVRASLSDTMPSSGISAEEFTQTLLESQWIRQQEDPVEADVLLEALERMFVYLGLNAGQDGLYRYSGSLEQFDQSLKDRGILSASSTLVNVELENIDQVSFARAINDPANPSQETSLQDLVRRQYGSPREGSPSLAIKDLGFGVSILSAARIQDNQDQETWEALGRILDILKETQAYKNGALFLPDINQMVLHSTLLGGTALSQSVYVDKRRTTTEINQLKETHSVKASGQDQIPWKAQITGLKTLNGKLMLKISPQDEEQYTQLLKDFGKQRFPDVLLSGFGIFLRGLTQQEMQNMDEKKKEIEKISVGLITMSEPKIALHNNDLQLDAELLPLISSAPVGGIDFDPSKLNLQIKRDGRGVPLPLPEQDVENINIKGLYPVILNILPVNAQTLPILGQLKKELSVEILKG